MRDIEFRAKRVDNGEWVYGNFVEKVNSLDGNRLPCIQIFTHKADSTDRWTEVFESELVEVDPKTVGQYTGLKDKNDKKIFEGDLLKRDNEIAVVEWHKMGGYIMAVWSKKRREQVDFDGDKKECTYFIGDKDEIIGNIHEHPELMR